VDGTWTATVSVPRYVPAGTWSLGAVTITDVVGNDATYGPGAGNSAFPPGSMVSVSVANASPDRSAPLLQSFAMTPTNVDVSNAAATVTVSAHLTDTGSGIGSVIGATLESQSSDLTASGTFTRTSGTSLDGTFTAKITIPKGTYGGLWKLSGVAVFDAVGNRKDYGVGANAFPAGSNTSITVATSGPACQLKATTISLSYGTVGGAHIGWRAPTKACAAISYAVIRDGGAPIPVGSGLSYEVNGLTPGRSYQFAVVVRTSAGEATSPAVSVVPFSPWSGSTDDSGGGTGGGSGGASGSGPTSGPVCSGGTLLPNQTGDPVVTQVTATSVVLRWADRSGQESAFVTQYSTNGGKLWFAGPSAARNSTAITVSGLVPAKTYTFQVGACNRIGTRWSAYATATTAKGAPLPNKPSNVQAVGLTSSSARLTWVDQSSVETSYWTQFSINGGRTWTAGPSVGANATTATVTRLLPGKKYIFQVGAHNTGGTHWSEWAYGTTTAGTAAAAACAVPVVFIGARGSGQEDLYGAQVTTVASRLRGAFGTKLRTQSLTYTAASTAELTNPYALVNGGLKRYLASIDDGMRRGDEAIRRAVAECSSVRIVLAGYSQGALVWHKLLLKYKGDKASTHLLSHIDGVILIADPARNRNSAVQVAGTANRANGGLTQQIKSLGFAESDLPPEVLGVSTQICDKGDLVCDTPAQLLFAISTLAFSCRNPLQAGMCATNAAVVYQLGTTAAGTHSRYGIGDSRVVDATNRAVTVVNRKLAAR
jgi:hypothetical protein